MRDTMEEGDARIENALSLGVLLAVSGLALFAAAANFTVAPGQRLERAAYPAKIAMDRANPVARSATQTFASLRAANPPELAPAAATGAVDSAAASSGRAAAPAEDLANESAVAGPAKATPFLTSDFSLGSGPSASNAIEIRKAVVLNGHAAGTVRMRVDDAAQVYVRADDIAKLLGGKMAVPQGGEQDFIALDKIRDRGVDVRYSASQDALLISS